MGRSSPLQPYFMVQSQKKVVFSHKMSLMQLLSAVFCISNQTRTNQSFGDAEVTFGIHSKSPQSSSQKFYSYLCFLRYVCFLLVSFCLPTFFLADNPLKNWTCKEFCVHSTFLSLYFLRFIFLMSLIHIKCHCHVATGTKNYNVMSYQWWDDPTVRWSVICVWEFGCGKADDFRGSYVWCDVGDGAGKQCNRMGWIMLL